MRNLRNLFAIVDLMKNKKRESFRRPSLIKQISAELVPLLPLTISRKSQIGCSQHHDHDNYFELFSNPFLP